MWKVQFIDIHRDVIIKSFDDFKEIIDFLSTNKDICEEATIKKIGKFEDE